MDRRGVVWLMGGAATLGTGLPIGRAAPAARSARLAWVSMDAPSLQSPYLVAFREGLRKLGWTEGRNLAIEPWWADGSPDRLRQQFPVLVASRPDVVVASFGAVRPLLEIPLAAPIVFAFSGDVVQAGIVQSWARPGVNRTGVSYFSLELVPKRLEIMREMVPGLARVAIVGWPPHPGELLELEMARDTCDRMNIAQRYYGVHTAAELETAFEAIARWQADGLFVFGGTVALNFPERIAAFATRQRIPAVSAWASFAERGNVMTYGPVLQHSLARLASFADRILNGARAADVPVELPTHIELVLNPKAARAIGLELPQGLLLRADRVLE